MLKGEKACRGRLSLLLWDDLAMLFTVDVEGDV
jgi:hypothetical protein